MKFNPERWPGNTPGHRFERVANLFGASCQFSIQEKPRCVRMPEDSPGLTDVEREAFLKRIAQLGS